MHPIALGKVPLMKGLKPALEQSKEDIMKPEILSYLLPKPCIHFGSTTILCLFCKYEDHF